MLQLPEPDTVEREHEGLAAPPQPADGTAAPMPPGSGPCEIPARHRRWTLKRSLLVLVLAGSLAMPVRDLVCIVYWRNHPPAQTAFMRREQERLGAHDARLRLKQVWVPYERISGNLKRAVVTAEDSHFVEHDAVDWDAVEKAYENNRRNGARVHGGSTLTQQLAKNLFLSPTRSYLRKGEEFLLASAIEACWSKRRILEVYLNVVEWGEGVFGAEAAARTYYGVAAAQLSAEQAARMAAFLPNPRRYGRVRGGPFLDNRTEDILNWMPATRIPD